MNDLSPIMTSAKSTPKSRSSFVAMLREHEAPIQGALAAFVSSRSPESIAEWASKLPEALVDGLLALPAKDGQAPAQPPATAKPTRTEPKVPAKGKAASKKNAATKKAPATANGAAPALDQHATRLRNDAGLVVQSLGKEERSMADLVKATGFKKPRLQTVLTHLREQKLVTMTGERGGARYQAAH